MLADIVARARASANGRSIILVGENELQDVQLVTDYGIDDKFMKDLAGSLQPGNAALFVLVKKVTGDKVLEALRGTGGTVLKTSLDQSQEQKLRDALADAHAAAPAADAPPAPQGSGAPSPVG